MPTEPLGSDPFDVLRASDDPVEPEPSFRAELRRRLEAAAGLTSTGGTTMSTPHASTTTEPAAPVRLGVITPYLIVDGAQRAIDWYVETFGARVAGEPYLDGDRIGHAELHIGDAVLYLADEYPELGYEGPTSRGGATASFVLHVDDPDATFGRAIELGATEDRPVTDAYGARSGWLFDPFGHRWSISSYPENTVPVSTQADDLWNEVGYYTLTVGDLDRARVFYGTLFGWRFGEEGITPDGDRNAHVESATVPFGIRESGDEFVHPYFRVADLDAAVATVERLGGTVDSVTQYESGGNAACRDDQGRRFDLWKPRPGY